MSEYKSIIYAKNMAGDVISLYHNFEKESEWDLRNKIKNMLKIDDPWRVCILERQDICNISDDISDIPMISYLILDKVNIHIKIEYKLSFLTIRQSRVDKYKFYVSYYDENYDYDVYYDREDDMFYSQDTIYNEEKYKDIKSLFLDTKFFPIMYREKIAHISNDEWIALNYS